jgi:hypothetical protein
MQLDISALLALLPSAVIAMLVWYSQKQVNRREAKRDEDRKAHNELTYLMSREIGAVGALCEATAHGLRDGKTNGEMTAALEHYAQCKHEKRDFLTKQGIDSVH